MSNNLQLSHQDLFLIQMAKVAKGMGIEVNDKNLYGMDFKDSWIQTLNK